MNAACLVSTDLQDASPRYDRQLLLHGSKRNAVLELGEGLQFGVDSFSDPEYLCVYGLKPAEWYARGARVLGRTAIECTPDRVAREIGHALAQTLTEIAADCCS
jgi:hypothetical protein